MAKDKYNEIKRNLFLANNSISSNWALLALIAGIAVVLLA